MVSTAVFSKELTCKCRMHLKMQMHIYNVNDFVPRHKFTHRGFEALFRAMKCKQLSCQNEKQTDRYTQFNAQVRIAFSYKRLKKSIKLLQRCQRHWTDSRMNRFHWLLGTLMFSILGVTQFAYFEAASNKQPHLPRRMIRLFPKWRSFCWCE